MPRLARGTCGYRRQERYRRRKTLSSSQFIADEYRQPSQITESVHPEVNFIEVDLEVLFNENNELH
ncbi:MAG: hypothetical protein ACRD06_04680 [Terriglobia bacterium]